MIRLLAKIFKHCPKFVWELRSILRRKKFVNFNAPNDLYSKIAQLAVLNANNPMWGRLADKWAVREYIKQEIGEQYLIPSLGCYKSADEIDFDSLPDSFVLKTNNGCGTNVIVPDKSKLDIDKAKKFLDKGLKMPYGELSGQLHYAQIEPLIVAEKFMVQGGNNSSLIDYKFYCVADEIEAVVITMNRKVNNHRPETLVRSADWKAIPEMTNQSVLCTRELECPKCYDELKSIVKKLAAPFNFVRVDMYVIDGKIYFGEFTFTPYADDHLSPLGLNKVLVKINKTESAVAH